MIQLIYQEAWWDHFNMDLYLKILRAKANTQCKKN